MELASAMAEAGRLAIILSTAEIRGRSVAAGACETDAHEPRRPTPRISQPTLLIALVTLASGAEGMAEVAWSRIDEASGVAETGKSEIMDCTTEIIGPVLGKPPAVVVGQGPRTPTPNKLQTMEFTTDVAVAAGADGTMLVS